MSFSVPEKNLEQLGIAEGMRVADFGCGSGFYSIAAARKVGPEGKVYGIDVQRDLLSRLASEASVEEMEHIEVICGDIETAGGSQLADATVDVVIVSNVLFQVESVADVLSEAYRVIRSGGRVLVVEWRNSFGGLGPKEDSIVPEQSVREALEQVGFTVSGDISAGDHHYGIVARKPK